MIRKKKKAQIIADLKKEILEKLGKDAPQQFVALVNLYIDTLERVPEKELLSAMDELRALISRIYPYIHERSYHILAGSSFENAVEHCKEYADMERDISSKLKIYDFYMEAIRQNLKYDLLTRILYGYPSVKAEFSGDIFPFQVYRKNDEMQLTEIGVQRFDLQKDCFVSTPDREDRLLKFIKQNPEEIETRASNYVYYTKMGIGFATNDSNHRTAVLNICEGSIEAHVYDETALFEHLYTDGKVWMDMRSNKILDKVYDFRIAILYMLARDKYLLCKE